MDGFHIVQKDPFFEVGEKCDASAFVAHFHVGNIVFASNFPEYWEDIQIMNVTNIWKQMMKSMGVKSAQCPITK